MSTTTSPMSRAMRELWGVREEGRRGPKPSMSVRTIAAAAVALADAEGLEAVTMAAVAKRLGFTTMSLYRYVESRQDLLDVMVDEAAGPPPSLGRRRSWRTKLEEWARADAAFLAAHPWVLHVRSGTPPVGPNLVGWMEVGFAALSDTGLSPQQIASSLLSIDGYVRSSVEMGLRYAADGATANWAEQLRSVISEDTMPTVAGILESGALEDGTDGMAEELAFGLGLLLDGIEQTIARRG
ncbi:TetR/AcrR family transcriptional regulator [Nocardioides fonticola]|uniref:TetR/AcrR family transcriptional regulator n=1 Tax=Nocardioides fonticola TaxID=450363 RepID=A0ABP7XLK6_9ACTN